MAQLEKIGESKSFGGWTKMFQHDSKSCSCIMKFSVFLPPQMEKGPVPALTWLSGLTCTHENFITKAGAQKFAAEHGIMLVAPDTSPRGAGIEGEEESYDLGTGAGFYVNATQEKWSKHYNMYDYIVEELPNLVAEQFDIILDRQGIFGHSMGGHGALMIALRNPDRFKSVSAFAPIYAPSQCDWGRKAFSNYLGENSEDWKSYDSHELFSQTSGQIPLLVDQGDADQFLEKELNFDLFCQIASEKGLRENLRLQKGYDHSYYFIASFMEDHIRHHARSLCE
ncbi:MAG: S-formylglutathione hydrolase [bacterium]|jgi:S-formylglutathione hydrolase